MAPKAFLILGILFFVKAIPFMKSESQMVNDSSTDVAQNSTSIVVSSSPQRIMFQATDHRHH
ncbi:hypothetical protein CK203_035837 [Vitis vinifera]|uniref:Uncharacterized protein n=1 Tax=Vitis vinifera TaxID=29760 RepID=A0A438FZ23_VITVI|nr:hypothetical protein CK203_035837 [Vitis vinifera]